MHGSEFKGLQKVNTGYWVRTRRFLVWEIPKRISSIKFYIHPSRLVIELFYMFS
jgi:hypothetical protein